MRNKWKILAIVFLSGFFLYAKRGTLVDIVNSLSNLEILIGILSSYSFSIISGYYSALSEVDEENWNSGYIIHDSSGEMEGIDLKRAFSYMERVGNYPASTECLRKLKSYQILAHLGAVLTLASAGVVIIYLFAEFRPKSSLMFIGGVLLTFLAEGQVYRGIVKRHDIVTRFIGSEGLGMEFIGRNVWSALKRSIAHLFTGTTFIALATFAILTLENFLPYTGHPEVLRGIHYLVVFTALTAGVGWIGSAFYFVAPFFREEYRNNSIPDWGEIMYTEIRQTEDGGFVYKTANKEYPDQSQESGSSTTEQATEP